MCDSSSRSRIDNKPPSFIVKNGAEETRKQLIGWHGCQSLASLSFYALPATPMPLGKIKLETISLLHYFKTHLNTESISKDHEQALLLSLLLVSSTVAARCRSIGWTCTRNSDCCTNDKKFGSQARCVQIGDSRTKRCFFIFGSRRSHDSKCKQRLALREMNDPRRPIE